jgi:hypothetical protein
MLELQCNIKKSDQKRESDRKWYEHARESDEFRERNRQRARQWRESNKERSRETTRLIMGRLSVERCVIAQGLPLPIASVGCPTRRRSSRLVKLIRQQDDVSADMCV